MIQYSLIKKIPFTTMFGPTVNYDNTLAIEANAAGTESNIYKISTTDIVLTQTIPLNGGTWIKDHSKNKEYLITTVSGVEFVVYSIDPASNTPATEHCRIPYQDYCTIYYINNDKMIYRIDKTAGIIYVFDLITKTMKEVTFPAPYDDAAYRTSISFDISYIANADLIYVYGWDGTFTNTINEAIIKISDTFTSSILYENGAFLTAGFTPANGVLVGTKLYLYSDQKFLRFDYINSAITYERTITNSTGYTLEGGTSASIIKNGTAAIVYGVNGHVLLENTKTTVSQYKFNYDRRTGVRPVAGKFYKVGETIAYAELLSPAIDPSDRIHYIDDSALAVKSVVTDEFLLYGYVEPKYTLTVTTVPSNADFLIEKEGTLQNLGKTLELSAGTYPTTTSADGYKTDTRDITITQNTNVTITLLNIKSVTFVTDPVDALVRFNDGGVWLEGLNTYTATEGEVYQYSVSKAGYITQTGTTSVTNQDVTLNVTLLADIIEDIVSYPGEITIPRIERTTDFPGMFSIQQGQNIKSFSGQFSLTGADRPTYIKETGSVTLAGADKLVTIIMKAASLYPITFVLTPVNAYVEILFEGSILTGKDFNLPPGVYSYQIKCDGYVTKTGELLVGNQAKTITETLQLANYTVTINTNPIASIVKVFYNNTWNIGKVHTLPAGGYGYQITATDYISQDGIINVINSDITQTFTLVQDLAKLTISNWSPTDAINSSIPTNMLYNTITRKPVGSNKLSYDLTKSKYQLELIPSQGQKYVPYYKTFELINDLNINPVFEENRINWASFGVNDSHELIRWHMFIISNDKSQILYNVNFNESVKTVRLLRDSNGKYQYSQLTDTNIIGTGVDFRNDEYTVSGNNEYYSLADYNTGITHINRVFNNTITNIAKLTGTILGMNITPDGSYFMGSDGSSTTLKIYKRTNQTISAFKDIILPVGFSPHNREISEDGMIVYVNGTISSTSTRKTLIYKFNGTSYIKIAELSDVWFHKYINSSYFITVNNTTKKNQIQYIDVSNNILECSGPVIDYSSSTSFISNNNSIIYINNANLKIIHVSNTSYTITDTVYTLEGLLYGIRYNKNKDTLYCIIKPFGGYEFSDLTQLVIVKDPFNEYYPTSKNDPEYYNKYISLNLRNKFYYGDQDMIFNISTDGNMILYGLDVNSRYLKIADLSSPGQAKLIAARNN